MPRDSAGMGVAAPRRRASGPRGATYLGSALALFTFPREDGLCAGAGSRDDTMAKWLVIAMGAVLALGGVSFIAMGWDIGQVERGWTEVIAGAGALGAGCVTMAIGVLIGAIDKIAAPAARREDFAKPARAETAPPLKPAPADIDAPSPARLPDEQLDWVTQGFANTPFADAQPAENTDAAARRDAAGSPTVIGEYKISGVTYVLYNDGAIVGETPHGARRFDSLTELRAYIDAGGGRD